MLARRLFPHLHFVLTCAATLAPLPLACCSGVDEDSAEAAEAEAPPVDPRFATAEALIAHFNELNTQMPPDLRGLVPLYHVETDVQRKQLAGLRFQAEFPLFDLQRAMHRQFGQGYFEHRREKKCAPAVLKKAGELRSEGTYRDNEGKERPLHLIKVDDRWWVSGYTLEYRITEAQRELLAEMPEMSTDAPSDDDLAQVLRDLARRVEAGEFASAEEVRDALRAEFRRLAKEQSGASR